MRLPLLRFTRQRLTRFLLHLPVTVCNSHHPALSHGMLVIRRMDDGKRSYTALFLPGEPARIFPTSNHEHARILQIYKQDRHHADVLNDFTEYQIGQDGPSRKNS